MLAIFVVQLAAGLLSACTAAPELLPSILGPPVVPKEASRALRRATYKPWEEFTMEYNMVAPEKIDWAEKLALLPKYENGDINWVKAFSGGMIKPKPGLDEKAEDLDTEDMVLERIPKDSPEDKAIFPHLEHTQVLACPNCHPAIFKKKEGAAKITMKNIKAGEFCGRCHGPVAFAVKNCGSCHPG
jgi:c(7)-type cytochrome triheme protein